MLKDKKNKARYWYLSISMPSFLLGGAVYLLFRTTDLYMFAAIRSLSIYGKLEALRRPCSGIALPDWIKYNMPDGLWLLAYMLLIEAIWFNDNSHIKSLFLYITPTLAVGTEFAQMQHLCPGTGDVYDIAAYIIAIILFLTIKHQFV